MTNKVFLILFLLNFLLNINKVSTESVNTLNETEILNCYRCRTTLHSKCDYILEGSDLYLEECFPPTAPGCYSLLDNNGDVTRGCLGKDQLDCGTDCFPCYTSGCNRHYFNFEFACFTCNSNVDFECATLDPDFMKSTIAPCDTNKCYTSYYNEVDDRKEEVSRGCLKENEMCEDPYCVDCDSNECNNNIFPTDRSTCFKCAGNNCLTINSTEQAQPCKKVKDKCYVVVKDDKTTYRGCLSEDPEHCLETTADLCTTCEKQNCNGQNGESPQNCYQCNVEEDPECRSSYNKTESCNVLLNRKIQCYSYSNDYIALRGCLDNAPDDIKIDCYNENPDCKKCLGEYCNKNILPEPRFKCIQCLGNDACKWGFNETNAIVCNKTNDETDECYIYMDDDKNVFRGCVLDVKDIGEICEKFDCIKCNTTACNIDNLAIMQCKTCESDQISCTLSPELLLPSNCSEQFLTYNDRGCYAYYMNNNVKRGCLIDLIESEENYCGLNNQLCQLCLDHNCNDQVYNINDICIECNEKQNHKCTDDFHDILSIPSNSKQSKGCFLDISKLPVRRGSASKLTEEKYKNCTQPENESCKVCFGNDCNKKLMFQECYICESTNYIEVEECLTGNNLTSKLCAEYIDKCVVYTTTEGYTKRGCFAETKDDTIAKRDECQANYCNNHIFPIDRLKCYECNYEDEHCQKHENLNEDLSKICQVYEKQDSCYISFDIQTQQFRRGCLTDKPDCSDNKFCRLCETQNCNTESNISKVSTLQCITCKDEEKCKYGALNFPKKNCTSEVFFHQEERCFTSINGANVERDCLLDNHENCKNNCTTCSDHNCNYQNVIRSHCIICHSGEENEEACADTAEGILPKQCPGAIEFYEDRGCYLFKKDNHVERGCISQLDNNDKNICKSDDNSECTVCYDRDCNNQKPNIGIRLPIINNAFYFIFQLMFLRYLIN